MANLATLKAALNAAVYQNNQNAITGESLNTIMTSIIDTLGTGYRYAGVATPSANPGTIDNRVFYLATAAGTYTNFGAAQLDGKSLHVFIYDTTWHDITLDVPTTAAMAVKQGSGTNSVAGNDPSASAIGAGSICLGNADGSDGAKLTASGPGSNVVGYAETDGEPSSVARLAATGKGAFASGKVYGESELTAEIIASEDGAHAEGAVSADAYDSRIEASGLGSHAEGYAENGNILASGVGSHAEGRRTQAAGPGSHAEGFETRAQNTAEHAEGKYNASHKKTTGTAAEQAAGSTLSSVGCGTGSNDRKNAVEVMQNGDVYIKGVGGYDGTNPAQGGVSPITELIGNLIRVAPANRKPFPVWGPTAIIYDISLFYAFIPFNVENAARSLFEHHFEDQINPALDIQDADYDNCAFLGISSDSKIANNGYLISGAMCCVYVFDDAYYYFMLEQ